MDKNKDKKLLKKKKDKDNGNPIQKIHKIMKTTPKKNHKNKIAENLAKKHHNNINHHNYQYHSKEPTAYTNYNHYEGPQI